MHYFILFEFYVHTGSVLTCEGPVNAAHINSQVVAPLTLNIN